jgi:hypothetical protein
MEIRGRTGLELLECYFLKVPVPYGHRAFPGGISGTGISGTDSSTPIRNTIECSRFSEEPV